MFSIVIPVGPRRTARTALESLATAGLEELDQVCIAIDKAANLASIPQLPCKVTVGNNVTNTNANATRNLGANLASCPFLTFLDDDDAFLPNSIKHLREAALSTPRQRAWCMGWQLMSERVSYPRRAPRDFIHQDMLYRNAVGGASTLTIERKLFNKLGGFDPKMQSLQDWDLYMRLLDYTNIVQVPGAFILYDDVSAMRISTSRSKKVAGQARFMAKHWDRLPLSAKAFHILRLTKLIAIPYNP